MSALPGLLAAQEIPRPAPAWGTASYSVRTIHGTSFRPIQSDTTYSQNAVTTHLFRTGGQLYFDYALSDLPAGALLTGIELEYCDTNPAASVNAGVHSRSAAGVNDIVGPTLDSGDAAIPGCGFLGSVSNLELTGEVVDNFEKSYWVRVTLEGTDDSTSLGAVRVYYRLQVSPAPPDCDLQRRPDDAPVFPVRRSAVPVGHHGRLRLRQLLPGRAADPQADGRIPEHRARTALFLLTTVRDSARACGIRGSGRVPELFFVSVPPKLG